jgi:hypothetical protein
MTKGKKEQTTIYKILQRIQYKQIISPTFTFIFASGLYVLNGANNRLICFLVFIEGRYLFIDYLF